MPLKKSLENFHENDCQRLAALIKSTIGAQSNDPDKKGDDRQYDRTILRTVE
jgi:hypothetical protein